MTNYQLHFYLAYIDVDYEEYCKDCERRGAGRGQDSDKEARICQDWGPGDRGCLRIETPRTLVDRTGVVMGWILPEVLLPQFQVCLTALLQWIQSNVTAGGTVSWNAACGRFTPSQPAERFQQHVMAI